MTDQPADDLIAEAEKLLRRIPIGWQQHQPGSLRICDGGHEDEDGCHTLAEAEILRADREDAQAVAAFLAAAPRLIRALLLRLGEGRSAPGWQPIESAPIGSRTEVLLCWWRDDGSEPMYAVGFNLGDGRRWQTTHDWLHNDQSWPTHWQPLPLPPETP